MLRRIQVQLYEKPLTVTLPVQPLRDSFLTEPPCRAPSFRPRWMSVPRSEYDERKLLRTALLRRLEGSFPFCDRRLDHEDPGDIDGDGIAVIPVKIWRRFNYLRLASLPCTSCIA